MLFRNGLYMTPNFDYALTGSSIQFAAGAVPQAGDTLTASYRVDTSSGRGHHRASLSLAWRELHTAAAQVICSATGLSSSERGRMDQPGWMRYSRGGLHCPATASRCDSPCAHSGSASGFNFQLNWGGTTISGQKRRRAGCGGSGTRGGRNHRCRSSGERGELGHGDDVSAGHRERARASRGSKWISAPQCSQARVRQRYV